MKVLTVLFLSAGLLLADPPQLQVARSGDNLVLSWNSDSVKPGTPALHYDFQVQGSDDLEAWTDVGTIYTGGVGGTNSTLTFTQPISSAPQFFRLQYQVNLKDQNLGGIDLTDADLSFADLTNTDLSGTNLTGAILTRAILQGTNLNNANLDNTVFSPSSEGLYNLTQLAGGTLPVSMLPDLPSYAADGDFVGDIAGFQLIPTSQRTVIIQLAAGAMIDDLNTLLTANNGQVAGSIASTSMQTPLMAIRFDSDATTIKTIRSNLQASPHVISGVHDIEQQERIQP